MGMHEEQEETDEEEEAPLPGLGARWALLPFYANYWKPLFVTCLVL